MYQLFAKVGGKDVDGLLTRCMSLHAVSTGDHGDGYYWVISIAGTPPLGVIVASDPVCFGTTTARFIGSGCRKSKSLSPSATKVVDEFLRMYGTDPERQCVFTPDSDRRSKTKIVDVIVNPLPRDVTPPPRYEQIGV